MKKKLLALIISGVLGITAASPAIYADEWEDEGGWEDDGAYFEEEAPDMIIAAEDEAEVYYEEPGTYVDYGDEVQYTEEEEVTYTEDTYTETGDTSDNQENEETSEEAVIYTDDANREYIEKRLDIYNVKTKWSYDSENDAWILSPTSAVAYPEIPGEQGVSVAVPGAYVRGLDVDRDLEVDITADQMTETTVGDIVVNYDAQITSTNGQIYTASTAPVIINTGAAGYSEQENMTASAQYAKEGYINVACGNRGKQSTAKDDAGNTYYTGDAPCCLVDQKNVVRFMKYNILLGNLPGNTEMFVSTGGSGGGAHAVMLAATSNHPAFYDYEHDAGAVGVYRNEDGSYYTSVNIFGEETAVTDGIWGCMAYSPITSLAEADMAMAFEYSLDPGHEWNTEFQAKTAEYLASEYMDYINGKNLTVSENDVDFDLNGDGDFEDDVPLTISYDAEEGYGGTYLTLYLGKFQMSLQNYLYELDYAEGWTWFDENGAALSDEDAASMTWEDKAKAFIEGRYAKPSGGAGRGGSFPGGDRSGSMPEGDGPGSMPEGDRPDGMPEGDRPDGESRGGENGENGGMEVGTPQTGTTQAAGNSVDSANYSSFDEMLDAYREDISEVETGDRYGRNIVRLYNPLEFIGAEGTDDPAWVRILMGASEGDISMLNSMNLEIAFLNAGTYAVAEWQWDGGHVPSEILGDSFSLYVDEMVASCFEDAEPVEKADPVVQTENGTAESPTGTDISDWVHYEDLDGVWFWTEDAAAYRSKGAGKATPGFDVMDYGQEDYVFGNAEKDARHWSRYVLNVFEQKAEELEELFNGGSGED